MEGERLGPGVGHTDEGSECSGDSYKATDSQSALTAVGEKLRKLHNGQPERVSSDEESVVEEVSGDKSAGEDLDRESVDSEEDFKLHVDVDLSDQEAGAGEDESEVIELSAGEDDDCEVLEIKSKEESHGDSRRDEAVPVEVSSPRKDSRSVEVVDIDDSGELEEHDVAAEDVTKSKEQLVEAEHTERQSAEKVAEHPPDHLQHEEEDNDAPGTGGEIPDKPVENEDLEMEVEPQDRLESSLESGLDDKEDKLEEVGDPEELKQSDLNGGNTVEGKEQQSEQSDEMLVEGDSVRLESGETDVAYGAGDDTGLEGVMSEADDFFGFAPSMPHSFSKEFRHYDDSDGEFVGTLYVSSDSHFFTTEVVEGPLVTSGSEAGDSSRFSPAPTENSRCNSPSVSSVGSERRGSRKRQSLDVSNPLYMKPFELGWKRELVYRSSLDSANRRMADVYYYTPTNKKIRSAREVLEHVDGVELTIKNFLFTKEPMGLDSSRETIRDAKRSLNTKDTSLTKDMVDEEEMFPITPKSSEKHKSPKIAETAPTPVEPKSPLGQAANSSPPSTRKAVNMPTPTRSFPRIKVTPTRNQKDVKVVQGKRPQPRPLLPKPREQEMEIGMLPPLWSTKAAMPKKATVSTTWSSTPKMVSEPLEKKTDPCSIHCPLKMGVIPTLQCRLCLCLYHPECVGLGSFTETIHSYVCKNCQMEIREGKTSLVPPTKSALPLKQFSVGISSPALPPPAAPRPPPPFRQMDPGKLVTVPRFVKTREVFAPQTGKQVGKKILGSVTTWLPSSASVQMPKATTSCEPVSSPPASMQSVAWMNGRKYIVVPKHNVLSVSPSPADKAPPHPQVVVTSSAGGAERSTSGTPGGNEASVLLGSPPGVLLVPLLPPADKGSALQTQYLIVNAPPGGGLILPAPAPQPPDTSKERSRKRASPDDGGPPNKLACMDDQVPERIQPVRNFMHDVCAMYNVLQHVFQYLKVQELLRAARVCRLWRDLAQHPSLWATVHMKNSKVSDWQGLASSLSTRRTTHLDLRKMLLPQRSDEVTDMWEEFSVVISRLSGLERLDLCRCPASVVQHVLTACPNLRTLNATAISCNSISLQDAGGLVNLEELRLKSLSGITLETSLSVLSQLSNLKHLALTTFRNLGQQGVDVIGNLQSLELLELGEVNNLPASFPAQSLSRLSNLRRLRLEKVQGLDTLTFNYLETARALPQLTQLELVNFDVKPGFDNILASCSNIKKLLIIPTYVTQSATTNRMVLGGVLQLSETLQQFVWGVTHELLRVTELFVDQCDVDQVKKEQLKKGDCIPVLKPVPGIAAVNSPSDVWSCEEKYGGPTPSVEILSLPKLHKLLNLQLPNTKVKLLKIPFHATWRQYLSDMHT